MNPFRPVKSQKISERIVQQIKGAILRGTMKPGDRLPPERELVERFKASRISVREALKTLETSGLLAIKPGSGVFVSGVDSKPLSESLSSLLRIQKASLNELTEARIILEPGIARLAAQRITPEEIEQLERNIEETNQVVHSRRPAYQPNIEFHSLLAEATHNPVIALMMRPLFDVLKEMNLEMEGSLQRRVEISKGAVAYHQRILKALKEKDEEKVYELMWRHVFQIQTGLKRIALKPE
jgi:GntR family transcriptional repressor for pyruvate dehydrogenase complex